MSVIGSNILAGASSSQGYQISRSVRLRASASAYFSRTFASAPLDARICTFSAWVKRGYLGANAVYLMAGWNGSSALAAGIWFQSDSLWCDFGGASGSGRLTTTQVFRDPSAWYHIVIQIDTTQATAANRARIYVNGSQVTAFTTATYPAQNSSTLFAFQNANNRVGSNWDNTGSFDGYLTEINFIDGQALTPAAFGETNPVTGVWQPKKYAGTYGTNGFYLTFADNSAATAAAIGKDNSGNGNNWTPNNISVTAGVTYDSMLDVPTQWADGGNGRGNYATLNPLKNTASISNANLQTVNAASAGYYTTYATASMDSGKYYWEIVATDDGVNARYSGFGIADPSIALTSIGTGIANTQAVNSRGWLQAIRSSLSAYTTGLYNNGAAVNTTTRATTSGTRIFMVAYDADTGKCWMGYEGTWWTGDPAAGTSQYFTATAPMMPVFNPYNDGSNSTLIGSANFGQRPFAYTPPSGFKALNTLNLPEPTILKGNQYFDVVTRTGTGSSDGVSQVISSLAFTPDLVWNKARSNAFNHNLVDSARGNDAILFSNLTNAETSVGTTGTQLQLTTNGFTAIQRVSHQATNQNGVTYADWCWKEGATQGFDIQAITAQASGSASFSHSLGVAPAMYIVKPRANVGGWNVYHQSLGATKVLALNGTGAAATSSTTWNNTAPTSTQFTLGSDYAGFGTQIVYLFAAVSGFSSAFSYTGNGSADGAFVFLGFRPRWIMIKRTDAADNWAIFDTSRLGYNADNNELLANTSSAEGTADFIDILSNGFKNRNSDSRCNANGGTYIGFAMAENPFKFSLGR